MDEFEEMILSGGASRGYYSMGCLWKYWNRLQGVQSCKGTSVGGLICLLFVCGFNMVEVFKMSLKIKFKYPSPDTWIQASMDFVDNYGLMKTNPFIQGIERAIRKKLGFIPTLKELRDISGKELVLTTCCLNTREVVYLSSDTHPDMSCILAADMTSRIPPWFTPILYRGQLYADGGLASHLPIELLVSGRRTLVIYIGEAELEPGMQMSVLKYFELLMNMVIKGRYGHLTSTNDIAYHAFNVPMTDINVSNEDALLMFLLGAMNQPVANTRQNGRSFERKIDQDDTYDYGDDHSNDSNTYGQGRIGLIEHKGSNCSNNDHNDNNTDPYPGTPTKEVGE